MPVNVISSFFLSRESRCSFCLRTTRSQNRTRSLGYVLQVYKTAQLQCGDIFNVIVGGLDGCCLELFSENTFSGGFATR